MAFTAAEKVDIRRYCGYPAYAYFGWVFEGDYATLELRMDHMSDDEIAVVRATHLPRLSALETDLMAASDNLDTASASVWTRNPNEVSDRFGIYNRMRRELCGFIGIRPGRGLGDTSRVVRA